MKLLNGIADVSVDVDFLPAVEAYSAVAETVVQNEIDLGEFEEKFTSIGQKIEEEMTLQEDPIELTEAEENFCYGLYLLLNQ